MFIIRITKLALNLFVIIGLSLALFIPQLALAEKNIERTTENTPPVADAQSVTTTEEVPLMIFLTGGDADGDHLEFSIATQPTNGTLTGASKNPTYTPNIDFFGTDSFTFTVNDGTVDSAPATVTISVTGVNDIPVAVDDTYETPMNTTLILMMGTGVLDNDIDPDNNTLTTLLIDNVDHGILTFRDDGSFVYKPDQNYIGQDTFTYRAFDGVELSNVATVTISVGLGNVLPLSVNDAYETPYGETLYVGLENSVLLNDTDENGDILTAGLLMSPIYGTLNFFSDGTFIYTPDAGFSGNDTFRYKANDGTGVSIIPAVVTITVLPAPQDKLSYLPIVIR